MSVHNELFFAPPEVIPQIVEDLRLILQNRYRVDVQERMSQGYELQVRKVSGVFGTESEQDDLHFSLNQR